MDNRKTGRRITQFKGTKIIFNKVIEDNFTNLKMCMSNKVQEP